MKIMWKLYYYDELTKFIVYHVSPNSMFHQRISGNKIDRTKRIKPNLLTYVLTSVKISPYFGVLIREGELVVDPKKLVKQIKGGNEDWPSYYYGIKLSDLPLERNIFFCSAILVLRFNIY